MTRVPGRVSVCIPTYNRCELLTDALASVLTQDVADVEILVGDDGSSDDETEALLMSLADPRISYLRNERNLGHAQNVNTLMAKATGEYLALLFDDDAMFPGHLQIVAGLLDRYPEALMAHTAYELWMTDGRREAVRLATEPFEESGRHFGDGFTNVWFGRSVGHVPDLTQRVERRFRAPLHPLASSPQMLLLST